MDTGSAGCKKLIIMSSIANFPHGGGGSARIFAYATAFKKMGVECEVWCLKASNLDIPPAGEYAGITYRYTSGSTRVGGTIFEKIRLELTSIRTLFSLLLKKGRSREIEAVLFYSPEHAQFLLPAWLAARLGGARFIGERTEYPFTGDAPWRRKTFLNVAREALVYPMFDGFIVISKYLEEYVRPRLKKRAWLLRAPIIVDTARFADAADKTKPEDIICYCGMDTSEQQRAVEIFSKVAADQPNWNVMIIGAVSDKLKKALVESEALYGISNDRIILAGSVTREEMPAVLARAKILILPRASGMFSTAGFPTKLGEYLATGRPVVVTDTGDISDYLADRQNAFLAPADDNEAFADTLRHVMLDYQAAMDIGMNGRQIAYNNFDARLWCEKILDAMKPRGKAIRGAQ